MEITQDAAKRAVYQGLSRRREAREAAEREAQLEAYERDMLTACHDNFAGAKTLRLTKDADRYSKAQMIAYRKEQQENLRRQWERDSHAYNACRGYVVACMGVMLVAVWTPLPWWAAAAFLFGTAFCQAAYIFRLYFPAE